MTYPSMPGASVWQAARTHALTVAVVLAFGLLMFAYRYLDAVAHDRHWPWQAPFINEMTGVVGAALLFPFVARAVRRWPLRAGALHVAVPVHMAGLLVFSITHTLWNWGTRSVIYPATGLGTYDYGHMAWRFVMELSVDVVLYAGCAVFVMSVDRYRSQQATLVRAAQLEEELARAEIRQLRLQLQPHFLFNALNTISSTMYENVDAADRMLTELSELLRLSLTAARDAEVTLATGLEIVSRYADLLSARFGEALAIETDVDPRALRVLVPSMMLQPLVENAVRHGRLGREGRGYIAITGRVDGTMLVLRVRDDGAGGAGAGGEGVGLSAIRRRLELLYGDTARLVTSTDASGFEAAIDLPVREVTS